MGAAVMRAIRFGLVLLVVLTLQTTLIAEVSLFGVRGDLVVLLAIAAAILGGPEQGAVVGFAAGLALDSLVQTPFGLSALAFSITGYVVGMFQGSVLRASWWIPVSSAVGASVLAVGLFAVGGEVLGQRGYISGSLPRIALIVGLINGALILPAMRIMKWALPPEPRPTRVGLTR